MAIRTDADKKRSLEHIFNMGFDEEFQIPGFELLGFDPLSGTSGAIKRITINALGEYAVNDIDESDGTVTYVGKEDAAGDWYIQKVDTSSGTSIRYATKRNNTTTTSYDNAWTNHGTLVYDTYSVAF